MTLLPVEIVAAQFLPPRRVSQVTVEDGNACALLRGPGEDTPKILSCKRHVPLDLPLPVLGRLPVVDDCSVARTARTGSIER